MRDGPEIMPVDAENTGDDAIHSCHSPERQNSPVPSTSDSASCTNDASNTKCLVVPESHETAPINAELHTEPKLLISDQENPLNEIQKLPLPAHSNSENEKGEQVEPVESDRNL